MEDHARAAVIVALNGETYNIGGHNEKQNLDVVKTIYTILDDMKPKATLYAEQITYVIDRPGHDMRYAIDASKIQREFGWSPQETFESGIRKTVELYLNNEACQKAVQDGSCQCERLGAGN